MSARDLNRKDIEHALLTAAEIGRISRAAGPWRAEGPPQKLDLLDGRLLANLFFEPSTRTASSFATAMVRMGGDYLNL